MLIFGALFSFIDDLNAQFQFANAQHNLCKNVIILIWFEAVLDQSHTFDRQIEIHLVLKCMLCVGGHGTARHDSIDAACDQPQPNKIPDQYFSRQSEITNNSNDKLFDTLFFRVNNNANSVDMLIILFCMLDQTKQEILMTSMPHTRAHISSQPKTLARFVQL